MIARAPSTCYLRVQREGTVQRHLGLWLLPQTPPLSLRLPCWMWSGVCTGQQASVALWAGFYFTQLGSTVRHESFILLRKVDKLWPLWKEPGSRDEGLFRSQILLMDSWMLHDVERAVSGRCLHFKMWFLGLTKSLSLFKELFPCHTSLLAESKGLGKREILLGHCLVWFSEIGWIWCFLVLCSHYWGAIWLIDFILRAKSRHPSLMVPHKLCVLK